LMNYANYSERRSFAKTYSYPDNEHRCNIRYFCHLKLSLVITLA